jgi:hypothetical protein
MVVIVLLGMPELRATSAVCAEPGFQSSAS